MQNSASRRTIDNVLWLSAGVVLGWSTKRWFTWAHRQLLQWLWPIGPLQLERPLVTFDIESTGTNVTKDKIVEIAAIKLMPDGTVVVKGPQRLNPGVPLSEEVTAIHGITDADVADCPRFSEVAEDWRDFLVDCDLHGYNAKKFDVPLLRNEFKRCGIQDFPALGVPVVDSFRIFCQNEPRTLAAAVRFYCGRQQHPGTAHSAAADAQDTLDVLIEQVRMYPHIPRSGSGLACMCAAPSRAQDITGDGKFQWRGDIPILAFGRYAGEPIAALITRHKDYLRWMSGQDFSDESLIVVAQALKGMLPTKGGGWEPLVFDSPSPQQQQPQGDRGSEAAGHTTDSLSSTQQQQQILEAGSERSRSLVDKDFGAGRGDSNNDSRSRNMQQVAGFNQQQQQSVAQQENGTSPTGTIAVADTAAEPASTTDSATTDSATADNGASISSWPELAHVSTGESAGNSDSWATAASSGSPDGWSMVGLIDPSPEPPTNPEPQQAQQEGCEESNEQQAEQQAQQLEQQ